MKSKKNIILIGNGSIAKIILEGFSDHPFCAISVEKKYLPNSNEKFCGLAQYPLEEIESRFNPENFQIFIAIGYLKMNNLRQDIYNYLKDKKFEFCNLIHKSSNIFKTVEIGDNNCIFDSVSLQPGSKIGNGNFIWSNSVIAHGAKIGNHNWIASGTVVGGNVVCGNRVFMGVNSSVAHNVKIADETFLGSGVNCDQCSSEGDVLINPRNYKKASIESLRFIDFMERT